jgi:hypothetical protein
MGPEALCRSHPDEAYPECNEGDLYHAQRRLGDTDARTAPTPSGALPDLVRQYIPPILVLESGRPVHAGEVLSVPCAPRLDGPAVLR